MVGLLLLQLQWVGPERRRRPRMDRPSQEEASAVAKRPQRERREEGGKKGRSENNGPNVYAVTLD